MGLFADYVVARPEDAVRHPSSSAVSRQDRGALDIERETIEGPSRAALGLLWADLVDEAWNAATHRLDVVASTGRDDGCVWQLESFPAGYLEAVATLPPARLDVALAHWLAREEMRGWSPADGRGFFGQLQALARSARRQAKGLYLYTEE